MMFIRPIKRFVLLLDDQPEEMTEDGIIVRRRFGTFHHDFTVVRVGSNENVDFGQGDTVLLADPNAGRGLMLDGIAYRMVRVSDIIAVVEPEGKEVTDMKKAVKKAAPKAAPKAAKAACKGGKCKGKKCK